MTAGAGKRLLGGMEALEPLLTEIATLLDQAEAQDDPAQLERTLTDGYAQALTLNLWPKGSDFGGPVKLIGCDPGMKGAPATGAANQALGREGGYDYEFVEGTGHLLQIEKPEECIQLTRLFLSKHGLA